MEDEKKLPVIEIFGPVLQGEGVMAGQRTHFLRMGGCDYRCSWCDSLYAVLPEQMKGHTLMMTANEIVIALIGLNDAHQNPCVTISGGNPAIHKGLKDVVNHPSLRDWKIVVETQGTVFADWLKLCDLITLSPKPPSSKMPEDGWRSCLSILSQLTNMGKDVCVKIVVFDQVDYQWALRVIKELRDVQAFTTTTYYLQPGTPQIPGEEDSLVSTVMHTTRLVTDWLMKEEGFEYVRVIPQLHALTYGYERGK